MKKNVFATIASIIGLSLFGSPAATQSWVRNYVSTNSYSVNPAPISSTTNIDGVAVSYTINLEYARNDACRIVSSDVHGMTNGTTFAYDGFGNYCNFENTACDTIPSFLSTNTFSLTRIENPTSVSNRYHYVTNRVTTSALDFYVNGVRVYGIFENGRAKCYGVYTNIGEIVFARCKISNAKKTKLLTRPRSISFLDLIFPSARAEWIKEKEKHYTGETEEVEGGYNAFYEQHYIFSIDDSTITLPSIDFYIGSTPVSIKIDTVIIECPLSGEDFCDNNLVCCPIEEAYTDIFNAIDACGDLSDSQKRMAKAAFDKGKFTNQISDAANKALKEADKGRPSSCPYIDKDFFAEEDEPPETPDPSPYKPNNCAHKRAEGRCGNWRCAACKKKIDGPSSHTFVQTEGCCAHCNREYKGAICGYDELNDASKHYFSGNGDSIGCICVRGRHFNHPGFGAPGDWVQGTDTHYRNRKCTRCNYHAPVDESPHGNRPTYTPNVAACIITLNCDVCGYTRSGGTIPHIPGSALFTTVGYDSLEHWNNYTKNCIRCGQTNIIQTTDSHQAHSMVNVGTPSSAGQSGHTFQTECSYSYAWQRCGYSGTSSVLPHSITWTLGANKFYDDIAVCSGNCGYSNSFPHCWMSNENIHYCNQTNLGANVMHLYGSHQHDAGSDTCNICGYKRYDPEHYEYEFRTITSSCGSCYIKERRGRPLGGGSWSDWNVVETHCVHGWNYNSSSCGCPACAGGNPLSCWCEHGKPQPYYPGKVPPNYPNLTPASVAELILSWGSMDFATLDGDDPVYDIAPYSFTNMFQNSTLLETVKFNYCTNVGDYAFKNCFVGCPNLKSWQFQRLKTIGYEAFYGCSSIQGIGGSSDRNISLPSVKTVGTRGFAMTSIQSASLPVVETLGIGAFVGAPIKSANLPSVLEIKGGAFGGCTSLTNVYAPNVIYIRNEAFEDTELSNISLPNVRIVEKNAFKLCHLTSIYAPSLIEIGESAFAWSYLNGDVLFQSVKDVGILAFDNVFDMRTMSLPMATNIQDRAFYGCQQLESASIPSAIRLDTSYSTELFKLCVSLTNVTCTSLTRNYIATNDYFSAKSGCVFHCSDGDVTVP